MKHSGDETQMKMEIIVEVGGEVQRVMVPLHGAMEDLLEEDCLQGFTLENVLVNGGAVAANDVLEEGDRVCRIPKSGKQG